ncbi:class I SAM-dependent methyltransferase [Anaerosinus sp.]|uniref:class I SAM-dependent methyltransferase n=1 Tax=Selenobaculum sp. TaxID=3074374 RepID=UPI003AB5B58D
MKVFDYLYKDCADGWGFSFRRSQLYRYDKYLELLKRQNVNQIASANVLEIACWNGFFTYYYLAPFFKDILGVDISNEAIKIAQKKYDTIDFKVDTIPSLESIDRKFTLIILNECLYYLDSSEQIEAINRIHQLCKEDGYLMISVNIGNEPYFNKVKLCKLIEKKFKIIDSDEMCIKKYYNLLECKIYKLVEITETGFWEKPHEIDCIKKSIAKKLFGNFFAVNIYNRILNCLGRFILFYMPIKWIDLLGHYISYDDNLSVYMILCKKK